MNALRRFEVTEEVALAAWHNLTISLYRTPIQGAAVKTIERFCQSVAQEHPGGIVLLTIIPDEVPMPDEQARAHIASTMSQLEPILRCLCSIHEMSGLRGAAVRSMLRALTMMSRPSYPLTKVGSDRAAAEAMSPFLDPAANAPQVEDALAQFRQQLQEASRERRHP